MTPKDTWTLAELAAESGVPPRTIRYYIARGLLDAPLKAGRNSAYSEEHLQRLDEIQRLQRDGRALAEIAHLLAIPGRKNDLPEPVIWQSFAVADDVTVNVRSGGSPWRAKVIRAALSDLAARLNQQEEQANQGGRNDGDQ